LKEGGVYALGWNSPVAPLGNGWEWTNGSNWGKLMLVRYEGDRK